MNSAKQLERAARDARMEAALARADRVSSRSRYDAKNLDRFIARAERLDARHEEPFVVTLRPSKDRMRLDPDDHVAGAPSKRGESWSSPCTNPAHHHCLTCACPMFVFAGERRRVACVRCIAKGAEPFAEDIALLSRAE